MISAKDEPDELISPAMDGLLRIHKRLTDGSDGESGQPQRSASNIGPTRLLVPASQAGSLIGKQGSTIKSIQDSSKCVVRIVGKACMLLLALHYFFLIYGYAILFSIEHMPCLTTLLHADQNKRK
jgi:hypothetical protein